MLFHGIGAIIGPPVTGWGFDAMGHYHLGFAVAAVSAVIGLVLYRTLMKRAAPG